MSAAQLFQIFFMSERIRELRMRALIHQRISASARQRAKRLTMIYLATMVRERVRSRHVLPQRPRLGVFLGREMPKLSEEEFLKKFHVSRASFDFILDKLLFHLAKKEVLKLIPVWKQVAVSLYALASTESFKSIGVIFGIDSGTVSKILLEFCYGINIIFQEEYMQSYPPTPDNISRMRDGFQALSGLSQTYGAVGTFRVEVKDSERNMRSAVKILAVADFRSKFTYVEVGLPGERINLLENSSLKDYHKCNKLFYSMSKKLADTSVPVFLVGDSSFQLQPFLMTPFQHGNLSPRELYFNAVLLKSHQCVDTAFAQLKQRFPRIAKCKNIQMENLSIFLKTVCIIHNILTERNDPWKDAATHFKDNKPTVSLTIGEDGMGMKIREEIANDLMSCLLGGGSGVDARSGSHLKFSSTSGGSSDNML